MDHEVGELIKSTVASLCKLNYLIGEKRGKGNTEYADPLMLAQASTTFNDMIDQVVAHCQTKDC